MSKYASSSQSIKLLLEMGISVILKDTLVGSGVNSQTSVPFIVDRSQDQVRLDPDMICLCYIVFVLNFMTHFIVEYLICIFHK